MILLSPKNESEVIYKIVKSLAQCEENVDMIVYGIQISADGKSTEIMDISSDKNKIEHLLHKLEMNKIKPEFLHEFVEDFLYEQYCDFVFTRKS